MLRVTVTRQDFLQDRQGRTFADVLNDPEQPLDDVLAFFTMRPANAAWRNPKSITTGRLWRVWCESLKRIRRLTSFSLPSIHVAPNVCARRSVWWFA